MKLDVDSKQRLQTALKFFLEFFKVCMGSFLVIFVPRKCEEKTCSISDNLDVSSLFHGIAVISNLINFLFFIGLYYVELKRENFCIKYLDVNDNETIDHLDEKIEEYKDIKSKMHANNISYKKAAIATGVYTPINFILSFIDLTKNWAGSSTFTPLISYTILISMKLHSALDVSKQAVEHERAMSAYLFVPLTYNDIDADHI